MDDQTPVDHRNESGTDFIDVQGVPAPGILDYCEIMLLSLMVIVGGPLNVATFVRSMNSYFRRGFPSSSRTRRSRQGSFTNSSSWSRSVVLRIHLTAANLFIIWFYGISQICWLGFYSWNGGDLLCRLIKFFHTFCFYLTSNVIVAIAIDRVYVATFVDRPLPCAQSSQNWRRRSIFWTPWIVAVMCSVPQLIVWGTTAPYGDHPDWYQCITVWMKWKVQKWESNADSGEFVDELRIIELRESIYGLAHLVIVFWCPAVITICSYVLIVMKFRRKIRSSKLETRRFLRSTSVEQFRLRAAKLHCHSTENSVSLGHFSNTSDHLKSDESAARLADVPIVVSAPQIFLTPFIGTAHNVAVKTLSKVKRKTVRASALISLAYVTCWTPYNALELWRFFDPAFDNRAMELLSNLIVLNAVVNPLIYDSQWSLRSCKFV